MTHSQTGIHVFYKKLISFYPRGFQERFSESMTQTFNDLYQEKHAEGRLPGFVVWMFAETGLGIAREHVRLFMQGDPMKATSVNFRPAALISAILLAVAFIVAPMIYLVGNLRDALGPLGYAVADFLYGPVWAASLITIVFILRERMGKYAPRRMSLALFAAVLAAGTMVLVACIRSANRNYHLLHPELHLENSTTVLVVWGTLVSGLTGAAMHFWGWALILIGSAGWTSHQLPRLLSILYLITGLVAWFVYLLPINEVFASPLGVIVIIWQGILLWQSRPEETEPPEVTADQPDPT